MDKLQTHFPGDIGVIAPVLLNLLELRPGEALYLPAGVLHAYLNGVGIELMANSDNVLRGGLTPKHIDVPELLRVLTFQTSSVQVISPLETPSGTLEFRTPAEEFRLATIFVSPESHFTSRLQRSVEILFCTEGAAVIEDATGAVSLNLAKGNSVLIPAAVKGYRLTGNATIYRADVP
jgi:mannose-6-phosphate isomerase